MSDTAARIETVLDLQNKVGGAASAHVARLASGREVVWLDVDGTHRKGALSADASGVIADAASVARH